MSGRDQVVRLAGAGFQILPAAEIQTHYVIARDGFVALVERRADDSLGSVGSPGLLTDTGVALLVWRSGAARFVSKGNEQPAPAEQVAAIRRFDSDLRTAINGAAQPPP